MDLTEISARYQTLTDDELLKLSSECVQLRLDAQTILQGELRRRGLTQCLDGVPQPVIHDQPLGTMTRAARPSAFFFQQVFRLYRAHTFQFATLLLPAMLISALGVLGSQYQIRRIMHEFPNGIGLAEHRIELLEIMGFRLACYLIAWIASCFSFAAISAAVEQIDSGFEFSLQDTLDAGLQQAKGIFKLSLLLFVCMGLIVLIGSYISQAIYWGVVRALGHAAHGLFWPITYLLQGLGLLVFSRLGLAIPAVTLDDDTVMKALFRSQKLTERRWLILAVLVLKFAVGGYIAAMLPFWLTLWIPQAIPVSTWSSWILWMISLAVLTIVEPAFFVGLSLLYVRETDSNAAAKTAAATVG